MLAVVGEVLKEAVGVVAPGQCLDYTLLAGLDCRFHPGPRRENPRFQHHAIAAIWNPGARTAFHLQGRAMPVACDPCGPWPGPGPPD